MEESTQYIINNLWILICTILVFIMHLGFSCVESGLSRAKNTVNILFKNYAIVAIGLVTYTIMGYGLMYPGNGWLIGKGLGFSNLGIESLNSNFTSPISDYTYWTDFLFQGMFAATAGTIVSGAVAERIKVGSFLLFSTIFIGLVYPILGSWKWGGGWLDEFGFYDFAGATLVHSVGGWGALAGVLLLGPRLGKYSNGYVKVIRGHNIPLATIGGFLLWFGWFGFNGGSVLSANPKLIAYVSVTTCLAAACGVIGSMFMSKVMQGKPDLTMLLNGSLAGLVSITASADTVSILSAMLIGLVGGVLVVLAVIIIDIKLKLDDPVGAISVHLVCGIWGTLAVGIFSFNSAHTLLKQFVGVAFYGVVAFLSALILFTVISLTIGLRVSEEEELIGLDISEHGMEAYPSMQIYSND